MELYVIVVSCDVEQAAFEDYLELLLEKQSELHEIDIGWIYEVDDYLLALSFDEGEAEAVFLGEDVTFAPDWFIYQERAPGLVKGIGLSDAE